MYVQLSISNSTCEIVISHLWKLFLKLTMNSWIVFVHEEMETPPFNRSGVTPDACQETELLIWPETMGFFQGKMGQHKWMNGSLVVEYQCSLTNKSLELIEFTAWLNYINAWDYLFLMAKCNGQCLERFTAPLSSRNITISPFPNWQAVWRGVYPI